jgi:hypothetical protein
MKNTILILFAAMMCSTANAQTKTEALSAYFNGMKVLCDSGVVVFKYERSDVNRSTDGGKTFEDVLKDAAAFQNGVSYGKLKTILLNGKTVKGLATATPDQVKPLFENEKPKRTFATMPNDSVGMKDKADLVKQGYDDMAGAFGTFWGYFFGVFWYVMYPLGIIGVLFFSISRLASKEYEHTGKWQDRLILGLQRSAALVLFIDVSLFMIMLLLQAAFMVSGWNVGVFWKLLFMFVVAFLMVEISALIIPNTKKRPNGYFDNNKEYNPPPHKQLNNRN